MIVATLSYEEMLRRHPAEVAEIISKLRKGKSKVRDADPATITWTYQACVLIEGSGTLAHILGGGAERAQRKWDALTGILATQGIEVFTQAETEFIEVWARKHHPRRKYLTDAQFAQARAEYAATKGTP